MTANEIKASAIEQIQGEIDRLIIEGLVKTVFSDNGKEAYLTDAAWQDMVSTL